MNSWFEGGGGVVIDWDCLEWGGVGFYEEEDDLPVWNRRNTRNKLVSANGAICTHGYSARYSDSGTRGRKKDGAEEVSNPFAERASNVANPSRILKSRPR